MSAANFAQVFNMSCYVPNAVKRGDKYDERGGGGEGGARTKIVLLFWTMGKTGVDMTDRKSNAVFVTIMAKLILRRACFDMFVRSFFGLKN